MEYFIAIARCRRTMHLWDVQKEAEAAMAATKKESDSIVASTRSEAAAIAASARKEAETATREASILGLTCFRRLVIACNVAEPYLRLLGK
eukprot:scaffold88629_cov17-Prasinocladus_malaysianus.AAC.1